MKKRFGKLLALLLDWPVFFALIAGFTAANSLKEGITPILFGRREYTLLSWNYQIILLALYFLLFAFLFLALFLGIRKLSRKGLFKEKKAVTVNFSFSRRITAGLIIIVAGIAIIVFINTVYSQIDTTRWTLNHPNTILTLDPVGNDFRTGLYRPPEALLQGIDIYSSSVEGTEITQYPPLLNVLMLPFQLLDENQAYLLEVFLLFAANIACLGLAASLVKNTILIKTGLDKTLVNVITLCLFSALLFYTLSSYGFLFSIERGNYDIIALLFALLSMFVLIKKPDSIWLQVILLSIATHLKIYPAALFAILLLKHGKKMILPTLIVNIAFLFVLGPKNAVVFFKIIMQSAEKGVAWVGNHSGFSYATYLSWLFPESAGSVAAMRFLMMIVPVILWIIAFYVLIKRKVWSDQVMVNMVMVTIPLMDLLPSISHDYKLVILNSAVLILLAIILEKIIRNSKLIDYLQLIVIIGLLFLLARSYMLNPAQLHFITNKYLTVVVLNIFMLANALRMPEKEEASPSLAERNTASE